MPSVEDGKYDPAHFAPRNDRSDAHRIIVGQETCAKLDSFRLFMVRLNSKWRGEGRRVALLDHIGVCPTHICPDRRRCYWLRDDQEFRDAERRDI